MDDGPVRYLIAIIFLLLLNGYFSGSEIALASVNRIRIANSADDGDKGAKRILYILDNFDKALSTLLIGNNVVHASISTLSTLLTYELYDNISVLPDYAVTLCTVITTVVVFFLGEMIPKTFAKACNEKFSRFIASSLIFIMKILTPVSFLFSAISKLASLPFKKRMADTPTVTEDELYDIIETFVEENGIDEDTEELVQNAIEFSESTVKEVMTPWYMVVTVGVNQTAEQVAKTIQQCTYSRLPVVDDDGRVVGTLSIRSFLRKFMKNPDISVADVMGGAEFIPDTTPVDDLLSTLSSKRTHIAYVRSGDMILGIITVEDILEQLVGEIYDEEESLGGDTNG